MDKMVEIRAKLAKVAHKELLNDDDKVRDLGIDSLDVVELFLQLEEEYNIHFDDLNMDSIITVKDLLAVIEGKLN